MKFLIAGGTGFVGRALVPEILRRGDEVTILTRKPNKYSQTEACVQLWTASPTKNLVKAVETSDVVINLAGEPVMDKRWSVWQKESIFKSRILSTRALAEAITKASRKPKIFISASAIGYYGFRGNEMLQESDSAGFDFLAETCRKWEEEITKLKNSGVRTAVLRIGVVFGHGGGAFSKIIAPFRLGLGGVLGSGKQWMSWIHRKDLVRMILWIVDRDSLRGVFNATSPQPVRMKDLTRQISKKLKRPSFLPVPSFVLNCILGERATLLLASQRIMPKAILNKGFRFEYDTLDKALENLV